jgi:ArpU family phage transcriptional regulator
VAYCVESLGRWVFDYEIYNEIGMSERRYYRLKARIFYKLAFILKIEEYKSEKHPV